MTTQYTLPSAFRPEYYDRISPAYRAMNLDNPEVCRYALGVAKQQVADCADIDTIKPYLERQVEMLNNYLGLVSEHATPIKEPVFDRGTGKLGVIMLLTLVGGSYLLFSSMSGVGRLMYTSLF